MSTSDNPRVEEIAAAIARYLALNPPAADSTTGIVQWWLPSMGVQSSYEEAEQALALLHTRRAVEIVWVGDHRRLWRGTGRSATT